MRVLIFCASLTLIGCAAAPRDDISSSTRMTDVAVDVDQRRYAAQQDAIKQLNDSAKHPVRSYTLAKAQCWLDVSFHEYTRNDRSPFPDAAFAQSKKITDYLASGGATAAAENPALQTPLVNNATRLREDLWQRAAALKAVAGYACVEQRVACGEVELVHAGNEFKQQQWNHAKPYVQIAEDLLGEAARGAAECRPVSVVAAAAVVAPAMVTAPPPPAVTIEKIALSASALFRFNRRTTGDLLPAGRAELDELAERISRVYARVERIQLVGYTDRLGSVVYNAKLSKDRADTVRSYLESRGVKTEFITEGRGPAEPVVQCRGNKPTLKLTACLQPNRRVELSIAGIKR